MKIQSNLSITNCSKFSEQITLCRAGLPIVGTTEDNMRAILLNVTIDPPDLKKGTKITIKGEIDLSESTV